jgi:hypothetical protein
MATTSIAQKLPDRYQGSAQQIWSRPRKMKAHTKE